MTERGGSGGGGTKTGPLVRNGCSFRGGVVCEKIGPSRREERKKMRAGLPITLELRIKAIPAYVKPRCRSRLVEKVSKFVWHDMID